MYRREVKFLHVTEPYRLHLIGASMKDWKLNSIFNLQHLILELSFSFLKKNIHIVSTIIFKKSTQQKLLSDKIKTIQNKQKQAKKELSNASFIFTTKKHVLESVLTKL